MNTIGLTLDKPTLQDSPDIYNLVTSSKPLDVNSRYAYMLVASHFRETSIVARENNKVVGFISGYILPNFPNILFIWQVAVDSSQRGKGLALLLLETLLQRGNLQDINFIDTTINPSNIASQKLFQKLAKKLNTDIENQLCFSKSLFEEDAHEDEVLYRIGPINITKETH